MDNTFLVSRCIRSTLQLASMGLGVFSSFFFFFLFCSCHSFWAWVSLSWLLSPVDLHMAQDHSSSLPHSLDTNELRSRPSTSMLIRPGTLLGVCAIFLTVHIPPTLCSYIWCVEQAAHKPKSSTSCGPCGQKHYNPAFPHKRSSVLLNHSEPFKTQNAV